MLHEPKAQLTTVFLGVNFTTPNIFSVFLVCYMIILRLSSFIWLHSTKHCLICRVAVSLKTIMLITFIVREAFVWKQEVSIILFEKFSNIWKTNLYESLGTQNIWISKTLSLWKMKFLKIGFHLIMTKTFLTDKLLVKIVI